MDLPCIAWPGFAPQVLRAELPVPLAELPSPPWLVALLQPTANAPLQATPELRTAVRDLLRGRGYRPTGRGKPSAEYLAAAAAAATLGSINAAVDAGNAVSLHSGLPISVVDADRLVGPCRIAVPEAGSSYVFNRSGQCIDVGGLVSLCDAEGPCANAVKDSQRTKTGAATRRLLAVVWAPAAPEPSHGPRTAAWLGEILAGLGAAVVPVAVVPAAVTPG
jgi:DNA/RNA-binding domain of Phe-tRNA-synthetase-like protein